MSVYVLDRSGKPLMPCSQKRARLLLERGCARVHRLHPFTIRVIDRYQPTCTLQPMRLSIDPGSKATGLALCRIEPASSVQSAAATPCEPAAPILHIRVLMELVHRGQAIRNGLRARAALRRTRRSRKTRYRAPRFDNRTRPEGWMAPSLQHRIDTTASWVRRLRRLAPVTEMAQELARFDMQAMQAAEDGHDIEGAHYQRGTLAAYEVGEYLLAKWGLQCAYCDSKGVPLQKEHITPKARGGSNRVSNLSLACRPCNDRNGARDVREFLAGQPHRLARVLAQARAALREAAAVNATRLALLAQPRKTDLPVCTGSGGRAKFNRARLGVRKTHALDAACVGVVADVRRPAKPTLQIKCCERGSRARAQLDRFGLPRGYLTRGKSGKSVRGFRTGDTVRATVASGKKAGVHAGRVSVRASGSFNIQTPSGVVQGISYKHCRLLMRPHPRRWLLLQPRSVLQRDPERRFGSRAIPPGPGGPGFSRKDLVICQLLGVRIFGGFNGSR